MFLSQRLGIKFDLSDHIKFYLYNRFALNGEILWFTGLKVAGFKVSFPIIMMGNTSGYKNYFPQILYGLSALTFIVATKKVFERRERKKIEEW